jgi:hypothetical protein
MRKALSVILAIVFFLTAAPAFGQEKKSAKIPVVTGLVGFHSSTEVWSYIQSLPASEPEPLHPFLLMRGYLVDAQRLRLFFPDNSGVGEPEDYEVYDFVLSTNALLGSDYKPNHTKASMVLQKKSERWTITIREPLIPGFHLAVVRNKRNGLAVGQSFFVP